MPDGSQYTEQPSSAMLTLPNLITVARLCAVPLAVWLVMEARLAQAFVVFVAAGASDAVDGWIARHGGSRSMLGSVLDPIADKVLLVSMYVVLAATQVLPSWIAILVVFRDVLIVGGVLLLSFMGASLKIRPIMISKVNTAAQLLLVAAVLMLRGFHLTAPGLETGLVVLVAITTMASGGAYLQRTLVGR